MGHQGSRLTADLIRSCARKSPLDLRQVLGALGREKTPDPATHLCARKAAA